MNENKKGGKGGCAMQRVYYFLFKEKKAACDSPFPAQERVFMHYTHALKITAWNLPSESFSTACFHWGTGVENNWGRVFKLLAKSLRHIPLAANPAPGGLNRWLIKSVAD